MQTPWAVILCKFTDDDSEPFPLQYYENLFTANNTGSPWNMIRYFHDCAHDQVDLGGTQVFGWYPLSQSVDFYNSLGQQARDHLVQWARTAAIADSIDLTPFYSVVVCTNLWHDIGVGPSHTGVIAQGPTPIPRLLGHEMGHVYGLMHSRIDGSDVDYQDPWDMMSAAASFSAPDQEFSLIGPGFNAWNMRSRGWLDEARVWKSPGTDFDETLTLRPLIRRDLAGLLAAEMPGGYLVEFRVRDGWDGNIPRPAVLVHRFAAGHSYLMPGNLGSFDLIAGDSFGDADPAGQSVASLFEAFKRVDVLSIDAAAQQATIRVRYRAATRVAAEAVDPMSVILPGRAYLVWLEIRHPHVPKVTEVEAALRAVTPQEQDAALARARTMGRHAKTVEAAMAAIRRSGTRHP